MNTAIVHQEQVSAQTLEHVLGTGDLSKLSSKQRVEYMVEVCRTLGLNPLTRPFRFMNFQGAVTLYATRDCADQLRAARKIDLSLTEKRLDGDLFIVTARAKTPEGRHDEDVGAVMLGRLQGDARANAVMKAITKAKRRVTLSICGLGLLDESEVETLPGAQVYDAEPGPAPQQAQSAATEREQINREVPVEQPKRTWSQVLAEIEAKFVAASTRQEVDAVLATEFVQKAMDNARNSARAMLTGIIKEALDRTTEEPAPPQYSSSWPGPDPSEMRRERERTE